MEWYQTNRNRFEIERQFIGKHHPGSKIIIKNGQASVLKAFKTRKDCYLVEAIFSKRHPYSAMRVFIREPALKGSPPHKFSSGELCLHGADDVGPETTAKVYLDWADQWIKAYERWLDGEDWPDTNRG